MVLDLVPISLVSHICTNTLESNQLKFVEGAICLLNVHLLKDLQVKSSSKINRK